MKVRFYSPAWHVFLNCDQGADPNQPNHFAYRDGNPFLYMDPTGMSEDHFGGEEGEGVNYSEGMFGDTPGIERIGRRDLETGKTEQLPRKVQGMLELKQKLVKLK
jgi:hypothetical protein